MRVDPELPPIVARESFDSNEETVNYINFISSTIVSSCAAAVGLAVAWSLLLTSFLSTMNPENAIWKIFILMSSESGLASVRTILQNVEEVSIPVILLCLLLPPPESIFLVLFGYIHRYSLARTFDVNYASRFTALCLFGSLFTFLINMLALAEAPSSVGDYKIGYYLIASLQSLVLLLNIYLSSKSFLARRMYPESRGTLMYVTEGKPEFIEKARRIWRYYRWSASSTIFMFCLQIIDAFLPNRDDWRPYIVPVFAVWSSFALVLNFRVINEYSALPYTAFSNSYDSRES